MRFPTIMFSMPLEITDAKLSPKKLNDCKERGRRPAKKNSYKKPKSWFERVKQKQRCERWLITSQRAKNLNTIPSFDSLVFSVQDSAKMIASLQKQVYDATEKVASDKKERDEWIRKNNEYLKEQKLENVNALPEIS